MIIRVALSRPCRHSTDFARLALLYGQPDAECYLERKRAGRRKGHHCYVSCGVDRALHGVIKSLLLIIKSPVRYVPVT